MGVRFGVKKNIVTDQSVVNYRCEHRLTEVRSYFTPRSLPCTGDGEKPHLTRAQSLAATSKIVRVNRIKSK